MTALVKVIPMIPGTARCIVYTRVSTEDQGRADCVSFGEQRLACETVAVERGLAVDHVIEDRKSGASLGRLDRLKEFCQAHPRPATARGLVIALDASRWGRFDRPGQSQMFIEELHRYGWDVEFARERLTGQVDADLIVGSARAIASKAERDRIRRRAHDSMLAHAGAGRWQGRAPFGYARVAVHRVTGRERHLDPYERASADERVRLERGDPAAVRTVQAIFDQFARGSTFTAIADGLNAARTPGPFAVYPNRGGVVCWTPPTVRAILLNPAYAGMLVWHRRAPAIEAPDGRKSRPHRPKGEWLVVQDTHPPLVDKQKCNVVQNRLTRPGQRRAADSPYLLTGLITCAACGSGVVGGGGSRTAAADPGRYRFYRCKGGVRYTPHGPACAAPMLTVNQRWLESRVIALVSREVTNAIESGALERAVDRACARHANEDGETRLGLERERRELEAQRRRLVEAVARGTLADEDAGPKLGDLKARLGQVQAQLQRGRFGQVAGTGERARLIGLARDFPARLRAAPPAVARELLAHWIAGITLDKSKRVAEIAVRRVPASLADDTPAGPP